MNIKTVLFLATLTSLFVGCATKPTAPMTFEERFRKADTNHDGRVSRSEFGYLMLDEAFAIYDKNKNGVVTLKEFVASGGSKEAFAMIDKNGNGKITIEELKLSKVGVDTMQVRFYEADVNKDGYITFAEALRYRERVRAATRG